MTRKKSWGAHARCCAIAIFQLTELNIKANPPCFARARAHVCVLMTQKSCAVEMRNAILRNYLKSKLNSGTTEVTLQWTKPKVTTKEGLSYTVSTIEMSSIFDGSSERISVKSCNYSYLVRRYITLSVLSQKEVSLRYNITAPGITGT